MHRPNSEDRPFMEAAIAAMQQATGNGPKVGAVVVKDGQVVTTGYRQTGLHAERDAIAKAVAAGIDVKGATVYTTLEPCVALDSKRESCTDLLLRLGVTTVVIGRYDTNPRVYREGWKKLRDHGLRLRDFDRDLRTQLDELNAAFTSNFVGGAGPTGQAQFDYLLNQGNFEVQFSPEDKRTIVTRWTLCGLRAIHAYAARPLKVAHARHALEFAEIDDPLAFDFDYSVRIEEGAIAVFVSDAGAVLAKVIEVHSGPDYGSPNTLVKIKFEVRPE